MAKFFTLQEAEDWIPRIEQWLRTAIEARKDAAEAEQELQAVSQRIQMSGGMEIQPSKVAEHRARKDVSIRRFTEAMESIQGSGCVVKDLDTGLIDFPAKRGADEVYLCWKLGEARIEFWHGMDEGFAGRKQIAGEFGESTGPGRPN